MLKTRAMLMAAASALALVSAAARADDYTDLLNILRAKGSLTNAEYHSLMAKHMHGGARHRRMGTPEDEGMTTSDESARQAAASAAASAAAAHQATEEMQAEMTKAEAMMSSTDIVHAQPYKPGAGLTMRVGTVDINVSAIVNAFYTYSSGGDSGPTHVVAGGLTENSGFDSSSVRNGLLPGALIISAATQQDGIDLTAVFGMYPGIDSTAVGGLNANNGGYATALGTAGVDFRKTYITAGTPTFGTIKLGRDIGLFGQDAILNDQTLLGVGATGGNANPGNTSLGRIGYGYIYTDFMPQITYITPIFAGFQASAGIFQPLNEVNLFTGSLSEQSLQHSAPMFQGRVTYDYKAPQWTAHLWAGVLDQNLDDVAKPDGTTDSKNAIAGEAGAALTFGPVGVTAYYYRAKGVGTTAILFDGLAANGELRGSEGGYIQASLKATDKLKLIGSYGVSSLYLANGEGSYWESLGEPNALAAVVRRNESETFGAYYAMTPWLTPLVEYTHAESKSHGSNSLSADSFSLGAILFY